MGLYSVVNNVYMAVLIARYLVWKRVNVKIMSSIQYTQPVCSELSQAPERNSPKTSKGLRVKLGSLEVEMRLSFTMSRRPELR
jgi:hypothetical protein